MIVGGIGYDTSSGLGHLVHDFYANGVIQRVMVIPHPRYQRHLDWYEGSRYTPQQIEPFLKGLDILLIFENAFNCWNAVAAAKARGVRFCLVPMYEWSPCPYPVKPDLVICPSALDLDYCQGCLNIQLTVPVDVPWRLREKALHFVHNAGHGQVGFAKGTPEVLQAMQHVKSPVRLTVRGQPDEPKLKALLESQARVMKDDRLEIILGNPPREQLYEDGYYAPDVFLNAERYNGLSLPLQEAHAAGMLVMTTDRFPANTWLPSEPLVPYAKSERHRVNQTDFDRVTVEPKEIARRIDEWFGKDISSFSLQGKAWAEANSWARLKPLWLKALAGDKP